MKILCLHGVRQSASIFAKKLFGNSFANSCTRSDSESFILEKHGFEFVFINGPYVIAPDLPKTAQPRQFACEMFSWWERKNDNGSAALKLLEKALETHHHKIEGVLGFSQGGALAAALCRSNSFWNPSIAIFISAYYVNPPFLLPELISPGLNEVPSSKISSLHIWGDSDQIVPGSKSQVLCNWMKGDFSVIAHGGHAVPTEMFLEKTVFPWLIKNRSSPSYDYSSGT